MDSHNKEINPIIERIVQIDPTVECIIQMFPEEFLRDLARKTGSPRSGAMTEVSNVKRR